ncbi:MAG: hypothetical protein MK212_13235 [Saprospiraceae bacterium]|nr:hypothetical protein [Saprospiraceae bacterium]
MKKNLKIWSICLVATISLSACGGGYGKKGAWSDNFKEAYSKACESGYSAMYTTNDANQICDCLVKKLEEKYNPTDLGSPKHVKDFQTTANNCIEDKSMKTD